MIANELDKLLVKNNLGDKNNSPYGQGESRYQYLRKDCWPVQSIGILDSNEWVGPFVRLYSGSL